ncbi:hypothetical protein F4823DRAFT_568729 [Ustulina deusta]|nr:hypothetical protein F4823DRAFT_568729 [Ustulina deusta]
MDACSFQGVPQRVQDNTSPTAVAAIILSTLTILAIVFMLLWWAWGRYKHNQPPRDDVELGERNSSHRCCKGVHSVPTGTDTQPQSAPATKTSHPGRSLSGDFEEVPLSHPSTPIQTAQAVPITQVRGAKIIPDGTAASSPTGGETQSPHFNSFFAVDLSSPPEKKTLDPTSEEE